MGRLGKHKKEKQTDVSAQTDRFGALFIDTEPALYRTEEQPDTQQPNPSQVPAIPIHHTGPDKRAESDFPFYKQTEPASEEIEFSPELVDAAASFAEHSSKIEESPIHTEIPHNSEPAANTTDMPSDTEEDVSELEIPDFLNDILASQQGNGNSLFPTEEEIQAALKNAIVTQQQADDQRQQDAQEQIDLAQLLQQSDPIYNAPANKRARAKAARREARLAKKASRLAAAQENTESDTRNPNTTEPTAASKNVPPQKTEEPHSKRTAAQQKRLFSRIIGSSIFCICVILSVFGFLSLRAQEVIMENVTYYDASQIVQSCGLHKNQFLPLINRSALSESITTKFPYIRQAQIKYRLPGKIIITATEDVPGFYTVIHDEYFLVSTNLRILGRFQTKEQLPPDAKELRTARISYAVVGYPLRFFESTYAEYLLQVLNTLAESELYPSLSSIDAQYRYDINLYYDNRLEIQIGSVSELASKLQFVQGILADAGNDSKGIIHVNDVKSATLQLQK